MKYYQGFFIFPLLLLLATNLAAKPAVIQGFSYKEYQQELQRNFKTLTLAKMLSQGLSRNYDEHIRQKQRQIQLLNWENLKESFWMPNISLTLQTSKQRLGSLSKGNSNTYDKDPTGVLALNFGEYTIFNWGKDYLAYQNNKSTIERAQEDLKEKRRTLKHQLIIDYFYLVTLKKLEQSKRNILRQAAFVYRFAKERISQHKIARHDYLAARDTYLQAQADFFQLKKDIEEKNSEVAFTIKDPISTKYVIDEEINFLKLIIPKKEALSLAQSSSSLVKQSKYELQNAKRNYEIALKESLPLPKITLDLGAYQHAFGNGIHSTQYTNGSGDSLEIVASVNATWSILGNGGLFNKRHRDSKILQYSQAQINNQRYKHYVESQINNYFHQIKNYEKLHLIYKIKLENLNKTFDYIVDRYMNNKISFLFFKTYLEELKTTEENYYRNLFNHLKYKVLLAEVIGIDDFPGDNFSKVATRTIK